MSSVYETVWNKKIDMLYLEVPDDQAILAALGVLTIRHGHLEYILRMTVKSLCDLSIEDALAETRRNGPKLLRERIKKEAKIRLGDGEIFDSLIDYLQQAWALSDIRNTYMHNLWARELDGPHLLQNDDETWRSIPSSEELLHVADNIALLTKKLNHDRLEGRLFQEIMEKKAK